MTMNFDDANIGGQLIVGSGVWPAIKAAWKRINGSMGVEGPAVIGDQESFAENEATLMVGKNSNKDIDCIMPRSALGVSGPKPTAIKTKGNMFITGDLFAGVQSGSSLVVREIITVPSLSPKAV